MTRIVGPILDSAGNLATGLIIWTQTIPYPSEAGFITRTPVTAQVLDGVILTLDQAAFDLPGSPDGTYVAVQEQFDGNSRDWVTAIPDQAEVAYGDLPVLEDDVPGGQNPTFDAILAAASSASASEIAAANSAASAAATLAGALTKTSNLSDLASAPTARTNLGLGNVDNTSDVNKPVSTAQAAAIAGKIASTEKGAASGVATLDSGTKIPVSQIPDAVKPQDTTKKPVGQGEIVTLASNYGTLTISAYGATPNTTTATANNTVIQNALNAVGASIAGGVVQLPVTGTGSLDFIGLTIPAGVVLQGAGGSNSRYQADPTNPNRIYGSTRLRCVESATGTTPAITMTAAASGLQRLMIDGNQRAGDILYHTAFESVLREVHLINNFGKGLNAARANNGLWDTITVSNCGAPGVYSGTTVTTPAVAAVHIWSDQTLTGATTNTNSVNIYNMSIEESLGDVALDIGTGSGTGEVQWARFFGLHLEQTSSNVSPATSAHGVEPTIRINNVDSLSFVDPYIYGGGPACYVIEQTQSHTPIYGPSNVKFIGGTILGCALTSTNLIHLVTGDGFSLIDTELDRFSGAAVVIDSTYGSRVYTTPSTEESEAKSGVARTDNRTVATKRRITGHVAANGKAATAYNDTYGTAASITTGSTDFAGRIRVGLIASTPADGKIGGVVFARAFDKAPFVTLTPATTNAAKNRFYVVTATSGFTIYSADAQASQILSIDFNYVVVQPA